MGIYAIHEPQRTFDVIGGIYREWIARVGAQRLYPVVYLRDVFRITDMALLRYRSTDGYNFDPAYTSHSHGWSSGPTSALTFYVLGLTITSPQGRDWSVAPHLTGLPAAEGGFETPLGWYGVKWSSSKTAFNLDLDTPEGTIGSVKLPVTGKAQLDGKSVSVNDQGLLVVAGGRHVVNVQT